MLGQLRKGRSPKESEYRSEPARQAFALATDEDGVVGNEIVKVLSPHYRRFVKWPLIPRILLSRVTRGGVHQFDVRQQQYVRAKGFRVVQVPSDRYLIEERYVADALSGYIEMSKQMLAMPDERLRGTDRRNLQRIEPMSAMIRQSLEKEARPDQQRVFVMVNKRDKQAKRVELSYPVIYGVAKVDLDADDRAIKIDVVVAHPLTQSNDGDALASELSTRLSLNAARMAPRNRSYRLKGVGTSMPAHIVYQLMLDGIVRDSVSANVVSERSDSIRKKYGGVIV